MFSLTHWIVALAWIVALGTGRQTGGVAALASPLEGAVVSGPVPLVGTATHPQFIRYELAFAYSPNPTDSWFTLQATTAPVINDVLGRWDTTQISDGLYTLRVRVFYGENTAANTFLEAVVTNVRVQNNATLASPTPLLATPSTPEGSASATPAIALPPSSTPRPTLTPRPSATPNADPFTTAPDPSRINTVLIQTAFLNGARLTALIFVVLGAYVGVKALFRRR
jgi:hypothetical protein